MKTLYYFFLPLLFSCDGSDSGYILNSSSESLKITLCRNYDFQGEKIPYDSIRSASKYDSTIDFYYAARLNNVYLDERLIPDSFPNCFSFFIHPGEKILVQNCFLCSLEKSESWGFDSLVVHYGPGGTLSATGSAIRKLFSDVTGWGYKNYTYEIE